MSRRNLEVRAGYIPLIDSAPLIAAYELGFAADEGLELSLLRETSWATIRDRLAVGHLDAAHLLAPMPIAANLGLNPLAHEIIAPMALGSGGNTITIQAALWPAMLEAGAASNLDATTAAAALARLVNSRRRHGLPNLVFGIVHPHSAHHYELAYLMCAVGIKPGRDVELVVIPPSLMPAALSDGKISGFCAGEPWGSVAAQTGAGRILTTNLHIWGASREKVLGVASRLRTTNEEAILRLVRAVYRGARWCDDPAHSEDLAGMLASPAYLKIDAALIRDSLRGSLRDSDGGTHHAPGFLNFAKGGTTAPARMQALWYYSQMIRLGQVNPSPDHLRIVRQTYSAEIYRRALSKQTAPGCVTTPDDGSHSPPTAITPFFDGRAFDPLAFAKLIERKVHLVDTARMSLDG